MQRMRSHAVVAFTRIVTSPSPSGTMRRLEPLLFPASNRLAFSMRPSVTQNSPS